MVLTNYLSGIADAIRDMDGSTEAIPAKEFPDRIRKIGGGVQLICQLAHSFLLRVHNW